MAFAACGIYVLARQREDRIDMVERAGFPHAGVVARGALVAKRSAVRVILGVAGGTVRRCAFERFVCVTLTAGHSGMLPRQQEVGAVVVKCGGNPAVRGVTTRTVCAEFARVWFTLCMAGCTVRGRALE